MLPATIESELPAHATHPLPPTVIAGPSQHSLPILVATRAPSDPVTTCTRPRRPTVSSMTGKEDEISESSSESVRAPIYLQPAGFYPLNPNHGASSSWRALTPIESNDGELSPEDDLLATRGIPIFRPTLEEFEDFEGYVTKTVLWGQYSGIAKIVPPADWVHSVPPITKRSLADIRIKKPIQQNMIGGAGQFRQTNVEKLKNKPLTLQQWFDKSLHRNFAGPGPKDLDRTLDRDSEHARAQRAAEEEARKAKRQAKRAKKREIDRQRQERLESEAVKMEDTTIETRADETAGDIAPLSSQAKDESSVAIEGLTNGDVEMTDASEAVPALDPSSAASPQSSSEPLATTPQPESIPQWYESFEPTRDWLPQGTEVDDYTPEACATLERKFWKNIGLGEPSWYGADLQGSLFEDKKTPWNVAHLPNLLNRLHRSLPGVNEPYLYFGLWRAAFAWHVEDMDLFSINYIHFGAPKFWYAVPQGRSMAFESKMEGFFPQDSELCDQFLRHKSFLISPTKLADNGIRVNTLVQRQNEFVITYPRGYHAGFNMGFNCAESVNFALESWLELGRRAKACNCVSHSVRIDVDELMSEKAEQDRKFQAENELVRVIQRERGAKGRKNALDHDGVTPRKRMWTEIADGESDEASSLEADVIDVWPSVLVKGMKQDKPRISLSVKPKAGVVKEIPSYPCVFCPSLDVDDLLLVLEPSEDVVARSQSRGGLVLAHLSCVNSIPEVWIEDRLVGEQTIPVVMGVNGITKDRWNLKCQCCADKKTQSTGAKIQCEKGKCPRAFHVSCARSNPEVVFTVWEETETVPIPILEGAPPGTQYQSETRRALKTKVLCPTHNPEVKDLKRRRLAEELSAKVLNLFPGSQIKIKTSGDVLLVTLMRVMEPSRQVEVRQEDERMFYVNWTGIDFRPGPAKLLENEYARPHTHIRKASEISSSCEILRTPSTGGSAPVTFPQRPSVTSPLISKNGDHQGDQPYPNGHYRQPTTLVPSQRSNRLAVDAMLNATPNLTRTDRNPSRVVVCDSENRQFGQPPPDRLYPLPVNRPFLSDEMPLQHNVNGHGCPAAQYQQQNLRQQPLSAPSRMPFMMDERQASTANSQDTSFVPQRIHHTYQPAHTESSASRGIAQPSRMSRTIVAPAMNSTLPNASAPQPQSRDVQSAPLSVASGVGKIDLGVARMRAIMSALPPLRVPAIHLAGTNGKGSVSAILESCLRAAGLRTARYNSPHLLEPRDAVRFNGMPPTPEEYAMATQHIQAISDYHELRATTFEIATAAAYHLINQRQPDVMIIECGLGGAGDATNVIPADVTLASALTSIGLDHTAFLGTSIAAITEQKANIAVSGGFLFVAPQTHPDALAMARRVSSERGANLLEVQPSTEISQNGKGKMVLRPFEIPAATLVDTPLPINPAFNTGPMPHIITNLSLPGAHQLDNVSLALTILHVLRQDRRALAIQPKLAQISNLALETGVSSARWSGRCSWVQWVDPNTQQPFPILVDGSHNEDSARRLREYIDSLVIEPSRQVKFVVSLSSSQGKTVDSVLAPLLRPGDSVAAVYFSTPVEGMPWVSPVHKEAVRDVAKSLVGEAGEVWVGNGSGPQAVQGALRWATADWDEKGPGLVVICGSLYLVADAYRLIRP